MAKNKKNINAATAQAYETNRKIRRDWGEISPITRVIPNKKKNRKLKHKGRMYDNV